MNKTQLIYWRPLASSGRLRCATLSANRLARDCLPKMRTLSRVSERRKAACRHVSSARLRANSCVFVRVSSVKSVETVRFFSGWLVVGQEGGRDDAANKDDRGDCGAA